NLFDLVQTQTSAHDGEGLIYFARILTGNDIAGPCNFMDFTTMPPSSTIGLHRHSDDTEEYYLILSGNGSMVLADQAFPVKTGDLIRNPPSGAHALINNGDTDLQMFVFELRVSK